MRLRGYSGSFFILTLLISITVIQPAPAHAAETKTSQYDFEGSLGNEWSTPFSTKIGSNKVLGIFNDRNDKYPKGAQLTISEIPQGAKVTLSFELYFIGSWDSEGDLADRWSLSVKGGSPLLELKKFPAAYRDKEEEQPIGNVGSLQVGNRNLPYWVVSQKVVVPAEQIKGSTVTFDFQGALTGRKTEFWALDNVRVEIQ